MLRLREDRGVNPRSSRALVHFHPFVAATRDSARGIV